MDKQFTMNGWMDCRRAGTKNRDLICSLQPGLCDHGDCNLEMKDLPLGIILMAKLRCPNKDNSSHFVMVTTSKAAFMVLQTIANHCRAQQAHDIP